MSPPANRHPGDITTHPLEDCPVCMELGDWASCEDSTEWIAAHEALRDLERLTALEGERPPPRYGIRPDFDGPYWEET